MNTDTIIGIGTARGGTQSLAHVLQEQGLNVGHEDSVSIDWRRERRKPRYARTKRHLQRTDGDVACWLTQAARDLLEDIPESKVIAVIRDKEDTVESLVDCFGAMRIRADKPFGPMCFPSYPDRPVEEAWAQYWDDYVGIVSELEEAYPGRVLTVALEDLEAEETQEQMAQFLGIDDWTHVPDCHKGKREDR